MDVEIPDLDAKGLRKFSLTVGFAIALVFGAALPFLFGFAYPVWPWIVAVLLISWGIIAPASLRPVYKGWMKVALLISKVTTPLVLGIVFVLLILPIGLFFRIVGRDLMNKRFDSGEDSYRDVVDEHAVDDLERPF